MSDGLNKETFVCNSYFSINLHTYFLHNKCNMMFHLRVSSRYRFVGSNEMHNIFTHY